MEGMQVEVSAVVHSPRRRARPWEIIHERLLGLAASKAAYDSEEAKWLLEARKAAVHRRLGYGSFFEYVERVLGYTPKVTAERLRVADALRELPNLQSSLARGQVNWSVARELTRVATTETEERWLDAARHKTVREVEKMVSGRHPGDLPEDPADDSAKLHTVRFTVNAETLSLLRDAQAKLTRDAGHRLEDDEVVRLLARSVLDGPKDEGRSVYQIAMTVCERCGRGKADCGGEALPLRAEAVEMAQCDAQVLSPHPHVGKRVRARQEIPPRVRRAVVRRHRGQCAVPGCRLSTFPEIHHLDRRSEGGTHDPDRLILLCSIHHAAEHEGRLIIEGRASDGFEFRHADGTSYGGLVEPSSADTFSAAFSALKKMGWPEGAVRQTLESVRPHVGASVTVQELIRTALRRLAPP